MIYRSTVARSRVERTDDNRGTRGKRKNRPTDLSSVYLDLAAISSHDRENTFPESRSIPAIPVASSRPISL